MYICICIYIYIHIHTYAFVYIWDKKKRWDNVPPPLPRLLPINSKSCTQVHELPLGHWWIVNSRRSTFFCLFDYTYTYIDKYMPSKVFL